MPPLRVSAAAVNRDRKPIRRATNNPSSDARVMMPNPPTWIRPRMTACPNPVQYVGVSTTVNPVTHTALVEVNNASTKLAPPGPDRA